MDIVETKTTELKYRSVNRLTVKDLAEVSADLSARKVPEDALIMLGTVNSVTVRFSK